MREGRRATYAVLLAILLGAGISVGGTAADAGEDLREWVEELGPTPAMRDHSYATEGPAVVWAELQPTGDLVADLVLLDDTGVILAQSRRPAQALDAVKMVVTGPTNLTVRVESRGAHGGAYRLLAGEYGQTPLADREPRNPVVAILDTGVDGSASPFPVVAWKDWIRPSLDLGPYDDGNHSTAVASALLEGAAGGQLDLVVGKVLTWNGRGSWATVAEAIEWAVEEQGAHVLLLSLGAQTPILDESRDRIYDALHRAADKGVLVVVANGNSGTWPGDLHPVSDSPDVLSVGHADATGAVSPSSDPNPALVAHGLTVCVARPRGSSSPAPDPDCPWGGYASGSSLAASVVAGLGARILHGGQVWPESREGAECLSQALRHGARDAPLVPYVREGYGYVDRSMAETIQRLFQDCLQDAPTLPNANDAFHAASLAARTAQHPETALS